MEITAPVVIFWFVMLLAGSDQPTRFAQAVEDLPACEFEAKAFMRKPPHELLLAGGRLTAGCEIVFAGSEDH